MKLTNRQFMDRLTDLFVEDILSMSDEEVIAEIIEDGFDPEMIADQMRQAAEEAIKRAAAIKAAPDTWRAEGEG
jgi:hypothetical protein